MAGVALLAGHTPLVSRCTQPPPQATLRPLSPGKYDFT